MLKCNVVEIFIQNQVITMITAYLSDTVLKPYNITYANQGLLKEAMWIDLLSPSKAEESLVEQYLALDIPTRDEMREIELSSRLYEEKKALFMTATMLAKTDSNEPEYDAVTFILANQQLVTTRYIEPQAFYLFTSKLSKLETPSAIAILLGLLDATVGRLADILEGVGHHLQEYSKMIFQPEQITSNKKKLDYQQLLQKIGMNADINTNVRESLLTFNRLIIFFEQTRDLTTNSGYQSHLDTLSKDINALSDQANFISNKINFLLDASLGMVTIEQNKIIKTFSIAAAIFLPPTLITGIYGMNFHNMPELSWPWGYPMSIGLILLSAWLPYKYFKYRKWL